MQAVDNSSAADQALEAVASMLKAHAKPEKHAPANASAHRAKVDLGFTGFENDLAQQVETGIRNASEHGQWTPELREKLMANVTGTLNATLSLKLKSVKQSIGMTWMGLPDPDQQDEYVAQLRSAFAPILASSIGKIVSHFALGVKRVQAYDKTYKKPSPEELLAKSEKALLDSLVNERCYNDDSFLQYAVAPAPPVSKAAANKKAPKFCIPPQLFTVAGNLNDTQGLISMGFKFEAHALSLVQIL